MSTQELPKYEPKMVEYVNSDTAKFQVSWTQFQGIVAYVYGLNVRTDCFVEDSKKFLEFVDEYKRNCGEMPPDHLLEQFGGYKVPDELVNETYLNIELEKDSLTRFIQKGTSEVANIAFDDTKKAITRLNELTLELDRVTDYKVELLKFSDIQQRILDFNNKDNKIVNKRCEFGLPIIDANTGGLCDGDSTIIAGASNQGKSWLAKHVAMTNYKLGKRVVLLTYEEMGEESIRRLDAIYGNIPSVGYINKTLDANQIGKLSTELENNKNRFVNNLAGLDDNYIIPGEIFLPDVSNIKSIPDILKLYEKYDADLVIIDQLSLITDSLDWKDIAKLVKDLKKGALQVKRPILTLSQAKINLGKGIEDIGMEAVALGEEISRNADAVIYIGNSKDTIRVNTKLLKLLKTRRGRKDIITNNIWDIDNSKIAEMGEYVPEVREKMKKKQKPVEVISPEDYKSVWNKP